MGIRSFGGRRPIRLVNIPYTNLERETGSLVYVNLCNYQLRRESGYMYLSFLRYKVCEINRQNVNVKCEKKRQRQTKHDPSPGITGKSPSNQSISLSNRISKSLSLLPIIIILCHLRISLLVRRYCHTNGQLIRIISLVSLHVLSVLTLQCVDKLRSGTGEEGQVDMAR